MTAPDLRRALEATWPPAATRRVGPWTIREGRGGGQRVSAASVAGRWDGADPAPAEAAMQGLGQVPIFLLDEGEGALDAALAARGYRHHDPVVLLAMDCATRPASGLADARWPPDDAACALWDAGGIGPARRAVMARVAGPKAALLVSRDDRPAGVAFVATCGDVAVVHALDVAPDCRRTGLGLRLMAAAAQWAAARGAARIALAVTEANGPARALYARIGMTQAGRYHYRIATRAGA